MKKRIFLFVLTIFLSFLTIACNQTSVTTELGLFIDEEEINLAVGGQYQINYTLNLANPTGTELVTFTSSDEDIATVSSEGLVTGQDFGDCLIAVSYEELYSLVIHVYVTDQYVVVVPSKTIYSVGDTLSLRGGSLEVYDNEGVLQNTISLTTDMLVQYDLTQSGRQVITFSYQGIEFGYEILVLDEIQEASLFADFIITNTSTLELGEKVEFALTKSNTAEFLDIIDNVYDYDTIDIYAVITSPTNETYRIDAFWYQEYTENITLGTIDSTQNLEGKVNDMSDDYDYILNYVAEYDPQYRMRFLPEEEGDYSMVVYVSVEGDIIQEFNKEFSVGENLTDDYKGFIQVDTTNNRHFVYSNGGSYIPVGQNVAWYTSAQRKYYDYLNWFDKMGDAGMNYARVWMSAWGYSIFWDDIYNYDSRQDNMYSLDRTIEIADDNDIYIQLCILHHGMFSEEVNPMWPNSTNTWYTAKYGSNPYAEYYDNPGLFFTSTSARATFKNQLRYIVARYGYSDNIMSWELFNEVDWVETYTAVTGTAWHREMSEYLKAIDPYNHMVTTSVKGDTFLLSTYQVFQLDSIDYVNVHSYGIYNHLATLPTKQNQGFEIFDKPILYDEVGFSGNGGADQISKDPTNITLHQELWAGALGGGGGTAMNWWWESWIEPYDLYSEYTGIAKYLSNVDLVSQTRYLVLTKDDSGYDLATISRADTSYIGYLVDDRAYLYIYDNTYALYSQNATTKSNVTLSIPSMSEGTYTIDFYDTTTGEITSSTTVDVSSDGVLLMTLPTFTIDIAIIVH